MAVQVKDIRFVHRVVGTKHVFTSPDVPELHVSHADEAMALADIQPALDALERIKSRIDARHRQAESLKVA
jgi:hypothetical protein